MPRAHVHVKSVQQQQKAKRSKNNISVETNI